MTRSAKMTKFAGFYPANLVKIRVKGAHSGILKVIFRFFFEKLSKSHIQPSLCDLKANSQPIQQINWKILNLTIYICWRRRQQAPPDIPTQIGRKSPVFKTGDFWRLGLGPRKRPNFGGFQNR